MYLIYLSDLDHDLSDLSDLSEVCGILLGMWLWAVFNDTIMKFLQKFVSAGLAESLV